MLDSELIEAYGQEAAETITKLTPLLGFSNSIIQARYMDLKQEINETPESIEQVFKSANLFGFNLAVVAKGFIIGEGEA